MTPMRKIASFAAILLASTAAPLPGIAQEAESDE